MLPSQCSRAALGVVGAVGLLTGCSGQGNAVAEGAGAAAVRFSAVAGSSPATACTLLAPETASQLEQDSGDCPHGLADADLKPAGRLREVEVYGLDAIVRLDADTVFLARFGDGWRVTAAGCTPQRDKPYDCTVKGA